MYYYCMIVNVFKKIESFIKSILSICKLRNAFTLAEVLITLLIIGVVASLVIPSLINSTNEAELNVGVKKAYADISNALRLIAVNNGSVNVGTALANTNMSLLRNDFCNVMSCVKTDLVSNIFGPSNYKYYKGGNSGWPGSNSNFAAILNNGNFVEFFSYTDCTSNGNGFGVNACGWIAVDINGSKGPNMTGKDFFAFWITQTNGNYSVLPMGTQGDTLNGLPSGCIVGSSAWNTSNGCTAKRLSDPDHMP